jgi:hypothetical protein
MRQDAVSMNIDVSEVDAMRIPKLKRRDRAEIGPFRFEYCCGAECDEGCRRDSMHEAFVRMSPMFGMRIG